MGDQVGTIASMDLSGEWVAAVADDDVRRNGTGLDTDVATWAPIDVPGHWTRSPHFATSDGPLMYRRSFSAPPPETGRRRWITFDGIFYQADVWLDGAYLGDPEGYFFPHTFDVTTLSSFSTDHVLAVEVTCAPQATTRGRRNITGAFQPPTTPHVNPGGLWRPVRCFDTGPVRIDRLRVLCRDADDRRAHLRIAARLDSDREVMATVRTSIDGTVRDEERLVVASGQNEIEWNIDIVDPALWWPRAIGDQPLVVVDVEVLVDDETSDRRARRTGLRQITWDNWKCSVNGERIFLKGANLSPTTALAGEATSERIRGDLLAAIDLGLDALRVHGHIADRELYATADELGLLLLQDFPLRWGHARSVRERAVEQARAAVDTLGHHPSIALWNAHDRPVADDTDDQAARWSRRARSIAAAQVPSWNRTVLDRWVKRALERADDTRQVVAHSGVLPHLPQLDGTDSHLWFGWLHGAAEDLATFAARLPRMVRFVSEFGADSAPRSAAFVDEQLATHPWPELDWGLLTERYGYRRAVFERLFPPSEFASYEEWSQTTQRYQAFVLRTQIETLRRLKYRPTGGFCFSTLIDSFPAISASILDVERTPKLACDAVQAACAPVTVVADPLPAEVMPGESLDLDVHVVNDLRTALEFAVVDAVATWPGGEQRWRFGGSVPADDVVKVGRLQWDAPDAAGPMTLDLTLTAGEVSATNRSTTTVQPSP
jgi:beta-mannosidase